MKKILLTVLIFSCLEISGQTVYANDGATSYLNTIGYINANFDVDGEFNVTAIGDIDITGNVDASGVNSNLQMHSISNDFSNLMISGTATGTATYLRYVNIWQSTPGATTGQNDLISAPFTNSSQTFGTFRAIPMNVNNLPSGTIGGTQHWLFGPYDNNISTATADPYVVWSAADDTEVITAGKGYRTGSEGGSTLSFTGDMLVGDVNVPVTNGTVSDWNLIGNPYATYIKAEDFLTANASNLDADAVGIYGYDGADSDGWNIINFNTMNTAADMAPGQAFMVQIGSGITSIAFTPSMRTMGTSDDFIPGRNFENKHFRLNLEGNNQYHTDFYFNVNSTRGLDPGYDAMIFTGSTPDTFIYSHLVEDNTNVPFAIQSLPTNDYQEDVIIPLGVVAESGEELTFSLQNSTLPAGSSVYLFDNEANTVTDISTSDYTVTASTDLTGTGRFYINFQNNALSIDDIGINTFDLYVDQNINHLIISSQLDQNVDVDIYDMHGRLVLKEGNVTLYKNNQGSVDLSHLSSGFYVAKVQSRDNRQLVQTKKIVLN